MNNQLHSSASAGPCVALWKPAWHQLDQTLVVDLRQRYFFYPAESETPPSRFAVSADLFFYNGVDVATESEIRFAKILKIEHETIGEILRVDTFGLDYILFPTIGEEVVIDAEEDPGLVLSGGSSVEDWSLRVTLAEVSEPIPMDDSFEPSS